MNTQLFWFGAGVSLTALVLAVAIALLIRPLRSVLGDLLGSPVRARFFTITLCALLVSATLAGSLMPVEQLGNPTRRALELNLSKQLIAAGAALLLGLGVAGGLLLTLILKYEARRA